MTPYEQLIEQRNRDHRIANWIVAFVVLVVAATVLAVCLFYHPERANASKCSTHARPCLARTASYNHLDVCESTLRGYSSDDDIHTFGVAIGAKSFGGWGAYGHYSDGSVWVNSKFNLTGYYVWVVGRCTGGDYASDWFDWS